MPEEQSMESLLKSLQEQLVRSARNGPLNSATKSQPYYTSTAADFVLETIDECLEKHSPVIWPETSASMTTLYLKWRQAANYIRDNMAAEDAAKLNLVTVTRVNKVGLKFKPNIAAMKTTCEPSAEWRPEFLDFISTADPGQNFEKIGILFTSEDKDWIYSMLKPMMECFVISVTSNTLTVCRV